MEEMIKLKKCAKCGNEYPVTEFYKNIKNKDGLQSYCKKCKAEVAKEYARRFADKKQSVIEKVGTAEHTTLIKVYGNPKLAEFTPRELMIELKARGFRWEYMLEPQRKIMYDKLK